ncbi:FAD-binding domain-containing protein [Trametopsis cervina]|nr:FAD-binding domain-containing protein [Trametopsis cervina]
MVILSKFATVLSLVVATKARVPITAVDVQSLNALNATVGGRLHTAKPVSSPCFSTFDGEFVGRDEAACAVVEAGYVDTLYRTSQFGAYVVPQWETCQATSRGCLLNNNDPSDPQAWQTANCSQGSVPPYYVNVTSPSDVAAALRFSRQNQVPLTVKNSGHDYKGRSSLPGALALWTRNIKGLTYHVAFVPTGCGQSTAYHAITIGAGVMWQEAYQFADSHNVTIIGGYHQSVGASGGWLLGGGHSVLSPVFGLGVDRVVQFEVVTADGVLRTANECQNQDLFFALRGGGGNAFGVVMSSTQVVEPRPIPLQVAFVSYDAADVGSQAAWVELMVDKASKWGQEGWGGHILPNNLIYVNPLQSLEDAKASMTDAVAFAQAHNGTAVVETLPNWLSFFNKYVLAAEATVGPSAIIGSRLIPTVNFASPSDRTALSKAIVNSFPQGPLYIVAATPVLYNGSYGGGRTSVTPAWRDSLWHLTIHGAWDYNAPLSVSEAVYRNMSVDVVGSLRALAPNSGSYFNEGDVYEVDHEQSYWGKNYQELLKVKQKYDPAHLLDCWQCVGWKGTSDENYSCYPHILAPN